MEYHRLADDPERLRQYSDLARVGKSDQFQSGSPVVDRDQALKIAEEHRRLGSEARMLEVNHRQKADFYQSKVDDLDHLHQLEDREQYSRQEADHYKQTTGDLDRYKSEHAQLAKIDGDEQVGRHQQKEQQFEELAKHGHEKVPETQHVAQVNADQAGRYRDELKADHQAFQNEPQLSHHPPTASASPSELLDSTSDEGGHVGATSGARPESTNPFDGLEDSPTDADVGRVSTNPFDGLEDSPTSGAGQVSTNPFDGLEDSTTDADVGQKPPGGGSVDGPHSPGGGGQKPPNPFEDSPTGGGGGQKPPGGGSVDGPHSPGGAGQKSSSLNPFQDSHPGTNSSPKMPGTVPTSSATGAGPSVTGSEAPTTTTGGNQPPVPAELGNRPSVPDDRYQLVTHDPNAPAPLHDPISPNTSGAVNSMNQPNLGGASAAAPDWTSQSFEPPRISGAFNDPPDMPRFEPSNPVPSWAQDSPSFLNSKPFGAPGPDPRMADTPSFLTPRPSEKPSLTDSMKEVNEHKLSYIREGQKAKQLEQEIREHQRRKADLERKAERLETQSRDNEHAAQRERGQISKAEGAIRDHRAGYREGMAQAEANYPLLGNFTDKDGVKGFLERPIIGPIMGNPVVVKAMTVATPKAHDSEWHADLEVEDGLGKAQLHKKHEEQRTKKKEKLQKDFDEHRQLSRKQQDEARELRRRAAIEERRINKLEPIAKGHRLREAYAKNRLESIQHNGGPMTSAGGDPNALEYNYSEMDEKARQMREVLRKIQNTLAQVRDAQAALRSTSGGQMSQAAQQKWDALEKMNKALVEVSNSATADLIDLTWEMKQVQDNLANMLRTS